MANCLACCDTNNKANNEVSFRAAVLSILCSAFSDSAGEIVDIGALIEATATPTAVVAGQAIVATAGTAVALPANAGLKGVTIKALSTNTGKITVGPSGVTNAINGTGNGFILNPGDSISLAIDNSNKIFINSDVSGSGVSFGGS